MAAKTPVIASNIPFFKDIAKRYDCLKIVQNDGDLPGAIKEALMVKNHNKMIKECARYLKENNWYVLAGKYKKLYSSLK